MTNLLLSAVTWTLNLIGFVLFSLHPNFSAARYSLEQKLRWIVFCCVLLFAVIPWMYLHIPVTMIAVFLLVMHLIQKKIRQTQIRADVIIRALIWIVVMMSLETCITWFGLGITAFLLSGEKDSSALLPLYWIVFLGMIQLLMQGFEFIRTETSESSRLVFAVLMVLQLPSIALLAVIIRDTDLQHNDNVYVLLLTLSYYLANAILVAMAVIAGRRARLQQMNQVQLNQYEYYLHMEEEHRKVRRLHHDLKNQLMMLQEHMESLPSSVQEQVKTTESELSEMDQFAHTGQRELNILLFNSRKKAEKKGIRFDFTISENSLNFMDSADLNSLFLNAVNNAFEACEKVTQEKNISRSRRGRT